MTAYLAWSDFHPKVLEIQPTERRVTRVGLLLHSALTKPVVQRGESEVVDAQLVRMKVADVRHRLQVGWSNVWHTCGADARVQWYRSIRVGEGERWVLTSREWQRPVRRVAVQAHPRARSVR